MDGKYTYNDIVYEEQNKTEKWRTMIGWEGDGMHAAGCMENLEDNQVSDFYFFTRETKDESVERLR